MLAIRDSKEEEWRHWQLVCDMLRDLGIDPNSESGLIASLKMWGERLAILRQDHPDKDGATFTQAVEEWERATNKQLGESLPH